ncbi:MAG: ATP-binding protein [Oscillospiraceae bacterium]|nr:ATP-binding protein [Oscillospiraceae bacterium]
MININNKSWDKLRSSDIRKLLSEEFEENCFLELKADDVSPEKLAHEISAFANTYGGYILLGINDDKTIGGCKKWNEQKINGTFHDNITPTPNFDVKKFRLNDKTIYVIKIEEGTMPPYITNKGGIYERISSGTCKITDSIRLSQLCQKKDNHLKRIKERIELDKIELNVGEPNNFCGYIDIGFSVVCSEATNLQKNFFNINFEKIKAILDEAAPYCSISRVGLSYVFGVGKIDIKDDNGNNLLLPAGLQNFIEIMADGSVRCRVILTSDHSYSEKVNISHAFFFVQDIYKRIYMELLGEDFARIFIQAHKYERVTVLKQFTPYRKSDNPIDNQQNIEYLEQHQNKYGNNSVLVGNRIPTLDYVLIDKQLFDKNNEKYDAENLFHKLFFCFNYNLGYIDTPPYRE